MVFRASDFGRSGCGVRGLATAAAAALSLLLGAFLANAQPAPPPAVQESLQEPAPAPASPAQDEEGGLINEMGRLFGRILPPLKSPGEAVEDLSRLAKPSTLVSGRLACPPAPNGAPDCKTAADRLCEAKGYRQGRSLNLDTAESCSARVLIPGRQRKPEDCRTNTFVTSALCQ